MSSRKPSLPGGGQFGKAPAHGERVGDLFREIVAEHRQVVVGKGLVVNLGGAQRRAGIADDGVGHGAAPAVAAEEMRGRGGGIADEADGAVLAPGARRADARRIGHHLGHADAGAMPRVHGEKRHLRQFGAHGVGVVGGDAGGAELLQQDGLEIDKGAERAREIKDRLAGADPVALAIDEARFELGLARRCHAIEPIEHQARRRDDGPAHEHRIGDGHVAEFFDDASSSG